MKKLLILCAAMVTMGFCASAQSVDAPKMERAKLGDKEIGFYKYTYDGNKWGLVDTNGVIMEEPIYEYVGWFVDGCAVVKKDGKYGFIDTTGAIVIPLVRCDHDDLRFYVDYSYHIPPMANLARGDEVKYHHHCNGDNENVLAQAIFLARLEGLRDSSFRHRVLLAEKKKIVYNFELVTGIRNNKNDENFLGRSLISRIAQRNCFYISDNALQEWGNWLKENKDKLRFCPQYGVLYTAYEESAKPTAVCGMPFTVADLANVPPEAKVSWETLQYSYKDSVFVGGFELGVIPIGISIKAEMTTNDSVLLQGEVFDSETEELMPYVFFFTVTKDGSTYVINKEKDVTDFDGKFSFKVSIAEAKNIIAHSVGYFPLLINTKVY